MPPPELKRTLSLPVTTLYGLGNILGAGIYVLVGAVADAGGMAAPVAFFVASLLAGLTAFSYAELSARHPLSAGEAVYIQEALGIRRLSMLVGLLIALAGLVSAATIARGFAGYLRVFAPVPDPIAVTLLVLLLGAIAAYGIGESVRLAALFTVIEVAGLLLVIWVGRGALAELPQRLPELAPAANPNAWRGVFLGAFLAFYAFIGFEDMVNVAEEVVDPVRNLPRAILTALGVATVLYALVSLTAVLSVAPADLAESEAPLAFIYERTTGRHPTILTIIAMFAVVNGALIQIIMASRILYGMSRQGWLPRIVGAVHPRTHTPLFATALVTAVVLVLGLWVPLVRLAETTSFLVLVVFILMNLALVLLKRRDPHPEGVRTYPMAIPTCGFIATTLFVVLRFAG